MVDCFRGLILGIPARDIDRVLRSHGIEAKSQRFSPLVVLVKGLSRRRLLENPKLSTRIERFWRPELLAAWALTAALVFATLTSFFLHRWDQILPYLVIGTAIWAVASLAWSFKAANRYARENPNYLDPWTEGLFLAMFADPYGGMFVIPILLFALLTMFVLLVLWLPLLVLVLSLLSLGELWRSYRCVLVTTEDPSGHAMGAAAHDILQAGGVLSKGWDDYVPAPDLDRSAWLRKLHRHVHRLLSAVAITSLAMSAMSILSRVVPSNLWEAPLVASALLLAVLLAALLAFLYRRRATRFPRRPMSTDPSP